MIKILIGTRSSLFLPFQNLGLIIIDEEHDAAYKPREVKPFLMQRCRFGFGKFYQAKAILGSATPSVESYYAAKNGKLKYVFLGEKIWRSGFAKI